MLLQPRHMYSPLPLGSLELENLRWPCPEPALRIGTLSAENDISRLSLWLLENKLSPRSEDRGVRLTKAGQGLEIGGGQLSCHLRVVKINVFSRTRRGIEKQDGIRGVHRCSKDAASGLYTRQHPRRDGASWCPPIHTACSPPRACGARPKLLRKPSRPLRSPMFCPAFSHDSGSWANGLIRARRRACECGRECSTYSAVRQGLLQAVLTPLRLVEHAACVRR